MWPQLLLIWCIHHFVEFVCVFIRLLQKSKQVSEPEGAPQNKYSISWSSARNTCSISRIFTMSSCFWQGMARSLMGNYEEIKHQCQHHTSHWKSVWQGPECSPVQWQHRRMVQNYSRSSTRVSALTNPLWHLRRENHVWGTGWPCR